MAVENSTLHDKAKNKHHVEKSSCENKAIFDISSSLKLKDVETTNSSLCNKSRDRIKISSTNGNTGMLMLIKTPSMRKITLTIFLVWILEAALYYGILLNASNFTK